MQEKVGNDEKAVGLAKYVADLVKTICQFLEPSKNELSEETQETLGEFEQYVNPQLLTQASRISQGLFAMFSNNCSPSRPSLH